MSISAADVKTLREQTGAGMMDCKRALTQADGDFDRATEILREKGLASVTKRADRATAEGLVDSIVSDDGKTGVMVQVDCETDFVAKGGAFHALARGVAETVLDAGTDDVSGDLGARIEGMVQDAAVEIREKLAFRKAALFHADTGGVIAYLHRTGGWARKGVLLEIDGDVEGDDLRRIGHELALHVQFARPAYLTADDVPEDVLARERSIAEAKARNEGKPDNIVPRIVDGAVKKYRQESVLLEQQYVKAEKKETVKQWLAEATGGKASIGRFEIFEVGAAADES